MTVSSSVAAETGLDLANPKLAGEVFAPAIAGQLRAVIPSFDKALDVTTKILGAYKGLTAASTVTGAVGAAISAIGSAKNWLDGQVDAKFSESIARRIKAKDESVKGTYQAGDWSSILRAQGPAPSDLSLKGSTSQYAPGVVWKVAKLGKDVLAPTWTTPPYDEAGVTTDVWEGGYAFPLRSPLTGFGFGSNIVPRAFFDHQPNVAAIPHKYVDNYWGRSEYLLDTNCSGFTDCMRKKRDTVIYEQGFAPPPDYMYLFSWGTYPYLSWSTASNNNPSRPLYDLSSSAAAIYTAIHSLTPLHAAIVASEVEQCYRAWLEATQIRKIPRLTPGQQEGYVFLDHEGLPWSPDEAAVIYTFEPGSAGQFNNKPWSPQNPGGCGNGAIDSASGCYRPEGWGYGYFLPWQVARDIEKSFRSFFTIRRAALYQMDLATKAFRDAAAASKDPILRAAAQGKPPPYKTWIPEDPLGDGWFLKLKVGIIQLPSYNGGQMGFQGGGKAKVKSSGGSGAALVAGGAALAAYLLLA